MSSIRKRRVGILISGRGSNMTALIEAAKSPDYPARIVCVLSNRPDAPGLTRAAAEGIATAAVDHAAFGKDRAAFEAALQRELDAHGVEIICLAGFMRLLTPQFVDRWRGRMINIHPSLLPLFKGTDTHARALAARVRRHGASVHYVTADMDAGPVILQGDVPVMDNDTPATLAARVLGVEHKIYPRALRDVALRLTPDEP